MNVVVTKNIDEVNSFHCFRSSIFIIICYINLVKLDQQQQTSFDNELVPAVQKEKYRINN